MRSRVVYLLLLLLLAPVADGQACQPRLGFEGTIVRVTGCRDRHCGGTCMLCDHASIKGDLRGYRVDRVLWRSAAARIGLERGDVIVFINNKVFSDHTGYQWAMRQVGDRAKIGVLCVRRNRLVWVCNRFGHRPHVEEVWSPPRGAGQFADHRFPDRCLRRCSLCR